MNYKEEPYPDITSLIKKCDKSLEIINNTFLRDNCIIIKDLYISKNGRNKRSNDFFDKLNVECNTKLKGTEKKKNEIKGLYVFAELNVKTNKVIPIYVGISRTILRRLYQHTWGTKHNETSFAYLKAKHYTNYKGKRENLPLDDLFIQRNKIKNYRLIVILEENDFDLYFMEVYLAGKLKTKWNSFKTH